jgi:hypothetical protein
MKVKNLKAHKIKILIYKKYEEILNIKNIIFIHVIIIFYFNYFLNIGNIFLAISIFILNYNQ